MPEDKPLITFQPVPVRPRGDGWTAERQIAFIEKLAGGNTVSAACRHVGMSRESARRLRCHPQGRAFRDAWDAAVDCRYAEVEEAALERSKNGVARPVFYKGEQVGEWRYFDERMTMFLLRFRRRHRFGPEADSLPRPPSDLPSLDDPDEQLPFDPEGEFEGGIVGIDFGPDPPPEEPDAAWPEADADDEQ
jgi:hypothetical protein